MASRRKGTPKRGLDEISADGSDGSEDGGAAAAAATAVRDYGNGNKRSRRGASPFDPRDKKKGNVRTRTVNGNLNGTLNGQNGARGGGQADEQGEHFQPGAIIRVKLQDFVTYSQVEFFPGPSLNMVIGPNGTGKSTLVCAICIGLGYDPKYLGRAKDVSEFVKHGADEAYIEIELAAAAAATTEKGDSNSASSRAATTASQKRRTSQQVQSGSKGVVVRCRIQRDGNKASYSLDRRPYSPKALRAKMARLGVQIDNLCQFLPQDRVVEFAGMTPVELLRSTQRAVASQAMLDWHDKLKVLRKNQRDLQNVKQLQDTELGSLQAQHRRQEADVQRIREWQAVRDRVRQLESIRPLVEYEEKVATVKEAQQKMKDLAKELAELQEAVEPALREQKDKEGYKKEISDALEDRKAHVRQLLHDLGSREAAVRDISSRIENHNNNTSSYRARIKAANTQRTQTQKEMRTLQARLAQPDPVTQDKIDAVFATIRRLQRDEREAMLNHERLQDERNGVEQQLRGREGLIRQQEARLRDLDSRAGKQGEKLFRINPDTARAWQWVQRNRDLFEKRVFGPPMLECSVRDPRDVDVVESLIPPGEMLMLTAQTRNDFLLLQKKLREQGLSRVNQRQIDVEASGTKFQPPVSSEHLERFGMDGWVKDRIEGPDVVIASLCEGARIHATGFASRELTDAQFQAASASNLSQWVSPGGSYRISRRREYGPSATTTTTRAITRAKYWSEEPIDASLADEIKRRITELTHEHKELELQIRELDGSRRRTLSERRDAIRAELDEARREQTACQKARRERDALPIKLDQAQAKLAASEADVETATAELAALEKRYDDLLVSKNHAAMAWADAVEAARAAAEAQLEAEVMFIEAGSDVQTLVERNQATTARLEVKRREHGEAQREFTAQRQDVRQLAARLKRDMSNMDDGVREFFDSVRSRLRALADLNAEIQSEQARLSLLSGDDGGSGSGGGTLEQYERRATRIEDLKGRLADCNEALLEVGSKIATVRAKWEPRLERLVRRISASFEYNMRQINCSGEVDVFKDEDDFDQWAITIRVKFREEEPLSQLDSHRQSGGERAVSTIFYLMSLQALTRSPFRVVDEINQGMDPRNERLVHARMVSIATGQDDMPVQQTSMPIHRRLRGEDGDDDGVSDGASDDDDDDDDDEDVNTTQRRRRNDDDGDDDEAAAERRLVEEEEEQERSSGNEKQLGSQYFLITPKLLPDLRYEPGMRVLCIGSGQHMPELGKGLVDFDKALQLRVAGGSGAGGIQPLTAAAAG